MKQNLDNQNKKGEENHIAGADNQDINAPESKIEKKEHLKINQESHDIKNNSEEEKNEKKEYGMNQPESKISNISELKDDENIKEKSQIHLKKEEEKNKETLNKGHIDNENVDIPDKKNEQATLDKKEKTQEKESKISFISGENKKDGNIFKEPKKCKGIKIGKNMKEKEPVFTRKKLIVPSIFESKKDKNEEEKPKFIPKKLDKSKFEFEQKNKEEEAIPKNVPKRLSLPILFQLNKEKKEEEKPKILPKKLDKNKLGFEQKNTEEEKMSKIIPKRLSVPIIFEQKNEKKEEKEPNSKRISKIDINAWGKKMEEDRRKMTISKKNSNIDSFSNTNIENRKSSVSDSISHITELLNIEEERKRIESLRAERIKERKKNMEEIRIKREEQQKKEEEERKKKKEEERIRREKEEAERKKKEEEERIRREKEEDERRKREEEERIKRENERKERERKEEEERKKREEEEKKLMEINRQKYEEEKKEREEKERIRRQKYEEEKKRREEEERIRRQKYEEEKRMREEEKRKREEEETRKRQEEERKRQEEEIKRKKEQEQKLKVEFLQKMNKKEEELTKSELDSLMSKIELRMRVDEYNKIKQRKFDRQFDYDNEGKNIQYTFEEIKQIPTEKIINIEVTKAGKVVVLTQNIHSKIYIYNGITYEEEKENSILLENKIVNSIKIHNDKIYCALEEKINNILIISLNDHNNITYLDGHRCSIVDLAHAGYHLVSADIEGNVVVWDDNKIKKCKNDFRHRINTITEINYSKERIAILSFGAEKVKFYDLRYKDLEALATIGNIKGSGFKNNMLKLNQNMLAIAGTYIYIIDINSFILANKINCVYGNVCISTSLKINKNKGFFFVGQTLTNVSTDVIEKGTLAYYEYDFISTLIPDRNPLIKIASKEGCHENFITSIRRINSDTIVTGGFDGIIKFWKIKNI